MPRLSIGDPAPEFSLPDADGNLVRLSELRAGHPGRVVVYFYPAALTPGCTTQACDFRDDLGDFEAAGLSVVGISPDPPSKLVKFREAHALTFPLLSDPDHKVLEAYGAWGEKTMYGKKVVGVIRSTVVVGDDGRVGQALYNVRAKGHVAKLRRDLGLAS